MERNWTITMILSLKPLIIWVVVQLTQKSLVMYVVKPVTVGEMQIAFKRRMMIGNNPFQYYIR